ncbi:hypothetical protein SAMN06298216_2692 [Spirosomataceae bacterium TFI 002]|nr:hypothetical protein SAMN06298216_2692 [Spirosomataceae bacterium TFI 002]
MRFDTTIHNCIIFAPPKTPKLKSIGKITYPFLIILCIATLDASAQKLEIGGSAGLLQYKGDLQPRYNPFSGRPAGGGFVRYNIIPALSIKGQGIFGFVGGKDKRVQAPQHRARGYEFSSQLLEYGGQIEYNFLDFRSSRNLRKSEGSPYLFVGYNSWTLLNRKNNSLDISAPGGIYTYSDETTKPYSDNSIVFGLGYKKVWKSNWNIGAEFGARKLSMDTFDSFGYIKKDDDGTLGSNKTVSASGNLPLAKFNVPNTHLYDMYFYLNFSVSYVFYKVHCPNPR